MTAVPLALSLSNTVLKAGALAAFAGLLGIAVLSLLVFSQARELKRLREWAGRAPERAAELEQRVSAEAAARAQRTVQPLARPGVGGAVPRTTPMVTRAAAAGPATQVASGASGAPAVEAPADAAIPAPAGADQAVQPEQPVPGQVTPVPAAEPASEPSAPGAPQTPQLTPATAAAAAGVAAEQVGAQAVSTGNGSVPAAVPDAGESGAPVAPLTPAGAAARVSTPAPRAPVPPSAARPVPPAPPAPSRQSAPRPTAVAARAGSATRTVRATGQSTAGRGGHVQGPPFLQEERSPGRATALIVGGVVVAVAVIVGVLLSLGGGSQGSHATSSTTAHSSSATNRRGAHRARAVTVASPAETHVVVLNSTETNGLAHQLSASLQQSGYRQAAALQAHPPEALATSVVEYAEGHRSEAQHVGQALGIGQVKPLEGAVAPLVGSATVIVIAGMDKAGSAGGETSSGSSATGAGEPSASAEAPSSAPAAGGEAPAGGEAAGGAAQ
jgi:hypothetical protein